MSYRAVRIGWRLAVTAVVCVAAAGCSSTNDRASGTVAESAAPDTVPIPSDTFAPTSLAPTSVAVESSVPTSISVSSTTTSTSSTVTTAPTTLAPAPNSEAALRQRVLAFYATNSAEQLKMPDTDFAESKAFFVKQSDAEEELSAMIEAGRAGGTVKVPQNLINEVVVTKVRMITPTLAEVSACVANNFIAMGGGPDKKPNTADDVVESDILDIYDDKTSWKYTNGLWMMRYGLEATTRKGQTSCVGP